jgi:hypothetical protein
MIDTRHTRPAFHDSISRGWQFFLFTMGMLQAHTGSGLEAIFRRYDTNGGTQPCALSRWPARLSYYVTFPLEKSIAGLPASLCDLPST